MKKYRGYLGLEVQLKGKHLKTKCWKGPKVSCATLKGKKKINKVHTDTKTIYELISTLMESPFKV